MGIVSAAALKGKTSLEKSYISALPAAADTFHHANITVLLQEGLVTPEKVEQSCSRRGWLPQTKCYSSA